MTTKSAYNFATYCDTLVNRPELSSYTILQPSIYIYLTGNFGTVACDISVDGFSELESSHKFF